MTHTNKLKNELIFFDKNSNVSNDTISKRYKVIQNKCIIFYKIFCISRYIF